MGNNPVLISDHLGDSLNVTFSGQDAKNAFYMLINDGLEGQFRLHVNKDNNRATLKAIDGKGDVSKLSKHGKAFYNELQTVMNGRGDTNVEAVFADSEVHTGRFYASKFDMADINQFNSDVTELGGTAMGKLIHELHEQYSGQGGSGRIGSSVFKNHHGPASRAEDRVNMSTRSDDPNRGNTQHFTRNGQTATIYIRTKNPGTWKSWGFRTNRSIIQVEKQ